MTEDKPKRIPKCGKKVRVLVSENRLVHKSCTLPKGHEDVGWQCQA